LKGLQVRERGKVLYRRATALLAQLPHFIGERECEELQKQSHWPVDCFQIGEIASPGPGNILMMELACEHVTELFASLGEMGVSSEKVARDLWHEARKFFASDIPVGPHLADQLILPMAIAASQGQTSAFRTCRLTMHSTTHIDLVQRFLPVSVIVTDQEEKSCLVQIGPKE